MKFANKWQEVRAELVVGMELRAWSRQKGYTSSGFIVADSQPSSITIISPTLSKPRKIAESDFIKVTAIWSDYCADKITRAEAREVSQNTSYIFGILKWLEDRKKGLAEGNSSSTVTQ